MKRRLLDLALCAGVALLSFTAWAQTRNETFDVASSQILFITAAPDGAGGWTVRTCVRQVGTAGTERESCSAQTAAAGSTTATRLTALANVSQRAALNQAGFTLDAGALP